MTTSYGHDQDAEPPTPDGEEPDMVESDDGTSGSDGEGGQQEPGSHPDPDPGAAATSAGTDG